MPAPERPERHTYLLSLWREGERSGRCFGRRMADHVHNCPRSRGIVGRDHVCPDCSDAITCDSACSWCDEPGCDEWECSWSHNRVCPVQPRLQALARAYWAHAATFAFTAEQLSRLEHYRGAVQAGVYCEALRC